MNASTGRLDTTRPDATIRVATDYAAAIDGTDVDRLAALLSPDVSTDFVHADPFGGHRLDRAETLSFWRGWFDAFPECDLTVHRTFAADDAAVLEWEYTLVHRGVIEPPILATPVPPTGRTIRLRGVTVLELTGEQVLFERVYLDFATLFAELGCQP